MHMVKSLNNFTSLRRPQLGTVQLLICKCLSGRFRYTAFSTYRANDCLGRGICMTHIMYLPKEINTSLLTELHCGGKTDMGCATTVYRNLTVEVC